MNTTITTVLAFFVLVEGHNWLLSPHSRNGNKDSQSKPCDDYIGEPKVLRVFQGEEMDVSWTTLHTGDPHSLYFVPASQEDNLESSNIGHVGDYPALQGLTNFTVPTVDPGLYILQYRWEIYRNCVDMQVLVAPPPGSEEIPGQPGMFLLPDGKGIFDANNGTFYCSEGYQEMNNDCVKEETTGEATQQETTGYSEQPTGESKQPTNDSEQEPKEESKAMHTVRSSFMALASLTMAVL